MKQEIS